METGLAASDGLISDFWTSERSCTHVQRIHRTHRYIAWRSFISPARSIDQSVPAHERKPKPAPTSAMATFPQLLRRSQFATFDPAISRVYASTPHSVNRYGDWGLKIPIHRAKGPRYIKVNKLDAGSLLGSDWRSAEAEARFVETYGSGRVPWRSEAEQRKSRSSAHRTLFDEDETVKDEEAQEEQYLDDVNSMTPGQFKRYLQRIRLYRPLYMAQKVQRMNEENRIKIEMPEDMTGANLAARGFVAESDTPRYMAAMSDRAIRKPTSKALQTQPHTMHGLMYSQLASGASQVNPLLYHPGRALDVASESRSPKFRGAATNANDTNRPWVVSIGGAGAESSTKGGRARTGAAIPEGVDFSRAELDRGEEIFRISKAVIKRPPRVTGWIPSTTRKRMPLDTFDFDIQVTNTTETERTDTDQFGSRDYVLADAKDLRSAGDALGSIAGLGGGIGGPRSSRIQGEAGRSLRSERSQEARLSNAQSSQSIQEILARLKRKL